jgi:AbrB family looped-hinge helix DNA binding protein
MSEKGRVVVPAPIREALGIVVGDALDWRVEDGEVRISTRESRLRRAQFVGK